MKYFTKKDFADAALVLSTLKVKTNCFQPDGRVMRVRYLVCIDDDITSAFYAMRLYHLIFKTYGYHPFVLCVGGLGPLSKHLNENGISEGGKLHDVCRKLGAAEHDLVILDKGTNTGLNCLDIYRYIADSNGSVIFCVTTRLSLRLERTFAFLPQQYPESVRQDVFDLINTLGVYWYVPDESLDDMMQVYNCKKLAKGVMFLAEIASIYDRIVRYSGTLQAPLDFEVPADVVAASQRLAKKYPLKTPVKSFTLLWQYVYAYSSVIFYKQWIKESVTCAIEAEQKKLMK